jgi:class 3 adenylate cyclase/tetratricopeptide (TPR) repeat protein
MNCGARLPALCPQCGASLPPEARFCIECGYQLGAPPSPIPSTSAPDPLTERLQRLVPQEYADKLLASKGQVASERRLVTILFSDIKGSTALAETLDPEDVLEIINDAFEVLSEPITRHEGTLARLMGDAVLAFFGAPLSHEDDPERAIRAALEIVEGARRYAARLEAERGITGFDVRVGINTGLVVVGEVGSDFLVEYTAVGDAINVAARMEQNAPPGGILIAHDTYRHVRGVFEVVLQAPLAVKGRAEPVVTYLVERAKPRAFRKGTRRVEGVETRTVGRKAELKRLQDAFHSVVEDGECQVVTIAGEAGVGKSRLLYEFDIWSELQPEPFYYFKGRASHEMRHLPHALLRDLFSFRFQIHESDPASTARDKLVQGITHAFQPTAPQSPISNTQYPDSDTQSQLPDPQPTLSNGEGSRITMKAHIIGHLLGFDFSASPHVQAIGDDAQQLRDRALLYIGEYFRAMAAEHPVVILLEDLHWADDSSLDALHRLAMAAGTDSHLPLLILGAARPALYERRRYWGQGQPFHSRLDLQPLSKWDSRRLVDEILKKVPPGQLPATIRDLVVTGAEGNPFFLEELIKMLVEEGVIRKGAESWAVDADRLGDLHVPPTLTGVLQARLDRLPGDQRLVLQQASVVGRLFWDLVVAHIAADAGTPVGPGEVNAALSELRGREMVFRRETSAFEGAREYFFKHALLREVTYEGILKQVRRVYHGRAADWLIKRTGERAGEYTGLIADHLESAGRTEEAVTFLRKAGEQAAARYANEEAVNYFSRALALTPEEDVAERYDLLLVREAIHDLTGTREAQAEDLAELDAYAARLDSAQQGRPGLRSAEVNLRRARHARWTGELDAAVAYARAAIAYTKAAVAHAKAAGPERSPRAGGDPVAPRQEQLALGIQALALAEWAWVHNYREQLELAQQRAEEAVACARESGLPTVLAKCLPPLGAPLNVQGKSADTLSIWEECLRLFREVGDRRGEAITLYNMGHSYGDRGDLDRAKACLEQSIQISKEIGAQDTMALPLAVLGFYVHGPRADFHAAVSVVQEALRLLRRAGNRFPEADYLAWLSSSLWALGDYDQAEVTAREGLSKALEIENLYAESVALRNMGLIRFSLGDDDQAHVLLRASLSVFEGTGARPIEMGLGLAALALVAHRLGHDEKAKEVAMRAAQISLKTDKAELQAHTSLALGHALAGLGDLPAAADAYRHAYDTYRQATWRNAPMEALAGLARVALAQGDPAQALVYVEEILDHLETGTLDGTFEPFRIYLTCVRVLEAVDDDRAGEVRRTAQRLLHERAATIEDEQLRRSFLENVPAHRALAGPRHCDTSVP